MLSRLFSSQVKQPILFLSGLQDELVPPSHMKMLYDKAIEHNRTCRFVDFPNGMHMDTWISGGNRYWRTIQLFLDHYAPEVQSPDASCKSKISEDGKSILSLQVLLHYNALFYFCAGD
jgi:abhydrolase domain-containing protein 13